MAFRNIKAVTPPRFIGYNGYNNNVGPLQANKPYGIPVILPARATPIELGFILGVGGAGNMDVAVFDNAFRRVWNFGSFAIPAAGAFATKAWSGGPLSAGQYWLMMVTDSALVQPLGYNLGSPLCWVCLVVFSNTVCGVPFPTTLGVMQSNSFGINMYLRLT